MAVHRGQGAVLVLILVACGARLVAGRCEAWCFDSCTALNGNVHLECDDCSAEAGHRCYPSAEGWDTWADRAKQFQESYAVGANGETLKKPPTEDGLVERTSKSVVYEAVYYEIAQRKRTPGGDAERIGEEWLGPLPVPQESPRHCEVHSCVLVDGDDACAEGRTEECAGPLGHLRPIGEQYARLLPAEEHDVRAEPLDAGRFWTGTLKRSRPLVLRGAAAAITQASAWTDEALLEKCNALEGGAKKWHVLVEKQNRITQNDRHPLMPDWTFCDFLQNYRLPEYHNMLYLVTSIGHGNNTLASHLGLPENLACDELYESLYDARLWMSNGNTTSSLHFDTHENVLLQIDGRKEVLLWHPNATGDLYMDHHTKYGLSPVNVDRVDLERFPAMARTQPYLANLSAGDALYLPDGWWHVIRSWERNVAIALEIAPYKHEISVWPDEVFHERETPGLYWAEQIAISSAMRERYAEVIPSRTRSRPIACDKPLEAPPSSLADCPWLGKEPTF